MRDVALVVIRFVGRRQTCPECRATIPSDARKCQHCASVIPQWVAIKCPACGERGKVSDTTALDEIECPACKRHFNLTPGRPGLKPV